MHSNLLCFILLLPFLFQTGPDIASMGLANSLDDCSSVQPQSESIEDGNGEIDLSGIDDDEIDSYIMSEREAQYKDSLWMKINATFLKEQKGILLSRTVVTTLHYKLINNEILTRYWNFISS
jgi:Brf1-like TBP-binding domain.